LPKKPRSFRFDPVISQKLDAWNLLLKRDKTEILEEAFTHWESKRSELERSSVDKIVEELKKHQ